MLTVIDFGVPLQSAAGEHVVVMLATLDATALSLTSSAEVLLGVIAGGAGTIPGPIVGAAIVLVLKNYVSAYLDRWNMLLGAVFVVIVIFMPEGVVPGLRRWSARLRKT